MENVSNNVATMPPAQPAESGGEMDAAMIAAIESVMFSALAPQIGNLFGASSPK